MSDIFRREHGNRFVCSDKADNILPRKRAEKPSIDRRLVHPPGFFLPALENSQQGFRVGIVVPYDSGEKFEFSLSGEHGLSIAPRGAGVKF
ncbi:MAG TPA: hypothetical protein DHU26_00985 [Spirochaetaceae bacterium]|jgi:hypothetical protein|nr:hypothetical protein [Spirochaetaceae bacterium]